MFPRESLQHAFLTHGHCQKPTQESDFMFLETIHPVAVSLRGRQRTPQEFVPPLAQRKALDLHVIRAAGDEMAGEREHR